MRIKFILSYLLAAVLLSTILPVPGSISNPPKAAAATLATLQPSDLHYLGFFKLPNDPNGTRFGFSYGQLAGRRVGSNIQLFITGAHATTTGWPDTEPIYEINYPGVGNDLTTAPAAALIHNWGDIYQGRRVTGNNSGSITGGLVWDDSLHGLYWTYGDNYNVAGYHDPSLGFTTLNDSTGAVQAYGPWRTTELSQRTRGYITRLGDGNLAVGSPPTSGNAGSPIGSWLSEIAPFNPLTLPPDTVGSSIASVTTTNDIVHDDTHYQMRPAAVQNSYAISGWNVIYDCSKGSYLHFDPTMNNDNLRFDMMSTVSWIQTPSSQGLVYFGELVDKVAGATNYGTDTIPHGWYGPSGLGDCYGQTEGPDFGGTGPHAASTTPWMWVYSPESWATTQQPAESSATRLDTIASGIKFPLLTFKVFGGAYYDSVSGLLFVSQISADSVTNHFEPRPIIHVFQVGSGTGGTIGTPTASLSASPSVITAGSSSVLSWTTANATSVSISPSIGSVNASGSVTVSPQSTTTYSLTATNSAGSTTSTATVTVNPVVLGSIILTFDGKTRDMVSGSEFSSPDGLADAQFSVALPSSKTVTKLSLTSNGATWDTIPSNGYWFLGVTADATSPLVNSSSSNINYTASSFKIYASDQPGNSFYFNPGSVFSLSANFSDGSSLTGNVTIPSATAPVGDLNGDHIVNSIDWSILNSKWFTSDATADLNHDGLVNSLDWSIMNANWLKTG